jgi:hypothetical protein
VLTPFAAFCCFARGPARAIVRLQTTMATTARITWTALVCLLSLCFACSPVRSKQSMAQAPDADYGGYDFEEDSVEGEMMAPEGAAMSSRGRARHDSVLDMRREFASEAESAPPVEPNAAPSPVVPQPAPVDTDVRVDVPDQPSEVPQQAAAKRQVIYTANMQVSVYDVEHAMVLIEALPDRYGGWLHERLDNQIILRIPAEHLQAAMDVIAELGVVDLRTLAAFDVTAEYTDLESRIRVLTQMQAQLELLLAKAKDVEQALEIRRALGQITMELELARARMRELSKSIAFSTLIVRLVARGPAVDLPTSNDPFPWVLELGVEATEYR